jgi:hypothetical protein
VLLLERVCAEMQGVGEDREREVDGGGDRSLNHLVWLSDVY